MRKLQVVLKGVAFFVVMVIFIETLSTRAKLTCGAFPTGTFPVLSVLNSKSLQLIESTFIQKVLRRSKENSKQKTERASKMNDTVPGPRVAHTTTVLNCL